MLLKHDYIRYLSSKLFNTPHGVDLFNNETQLINDITDQGLNTVWRDISSILWTAKNAPGGYYTNADNLKTNICRELLMQISQKTPERLKDLSSYYDGTLYQVPVLVGDSITFKFTMNPAANQEKLTGLSSIIPARSYAIKLIIVWTTDLITNKLLDLTIPVD